MGYKPRNIKINFLADTKNFDSAIDRVEKRITATYVAANKLNQTLGKQQTVISGINKLNNEYKKTEQNLKGVRNRMTEIQNTIDKGGLGSKEINKLTSEYNALLRTSKSYNKNLEDISKQLDKENNKLIRINAEMDKIEQDAKDRLNTEQKITSEEDKQVQKQQKLKAIGDERRAQTKKMLQDIKSIGNELSSVGRGLTALGVGTATGIISTASTYTNTFNEPSKILALRHQEMGSTTIDQWNNYMMMLSKQSGMSSSEVGQIVAGMGNTTSLSNTLTQAPTWADFGFATGSSGDAAGQIAAVYSNVASQNGWRDAQEYADYMAMAIGLGGGSPEQFISAMNQLEVIGADFNRGSGDPGSMARTLAIATAVDPEVAKMATGIRQGVTDTMKKDAVKFFNAMAAGHGMTNAQYTSTIADPILKYLGTSMKELGLSNGIHSLSDIHKMPFDVFSILLDSAIEDAGGIDKYVTLEDGRKITPQELFGSLVTMGTGNQRNLTYLGMMGEAWKTGKAQEVMTKLTRENADGYVSNTNEKIQESTFGRLQKSLNSISTNFMILASRLAPFMAGFLEKLVKWTDVFEKIDWEEGLEWGEKLCDLIITLTILGGGLLIISKIISLFADLGLILHTLPGLLNFFGNTTTNSAKGLAGTFSWFSKGMVNSGAVVAEGAKTAATGAATAGSGMLVLAGKIGILVAAIAAAVAQIGYLVADSKAFGSSQEYLQGKEDALNKKNTVAADAYNRTYSTAYNAMYGEFAEGNYLSALGYGLGGTFLNFGSFITGLKTSNDIENDNAPNYLKLWQKQANGETLTGNEEFVANAAKLFYFGDHLAFSNNQDKINNTYDEHQGNYVEPGLENAESYFNKEEDNIQSLIDKMLGELNSDTTNYMPNTGDLFGPLNEDALYDAISDGAKDGTEKGVKNALQGHFNIADTYSVLGQVGLGQLNQYEGFGIKKQGNQTVVNNNNVSIYIEGNEEKIMATLEKVLGNTGALSGATSYSIA